MLTTLSRPRPWYEGLIAWAVRLLNRRQPERSTLVTERRFPIPASELHRYARSADECFYREVTVTNYRHLPPVRMREYRS